ncbi:MAG TPA: MoaD/ThiS family protein [Candidatus Thermoplasmatota archaeon]|nr:MoaD/ThiS family protein [Candidatus Thermoplasmatota archaeon]
MSSSTVKVRIPTALRAYTGNQAAVEVPAATVQEALQSLLGRFDGLRAHLLDDQGKVRSFVNLYVNQTDVRSLQNEATPLRSGDTLLIVPSVAGGA